MTTAPENVVSPMNAYVCVVFPDLHTFGTATVVVYRHSLLSMMCAFVRQKGPILGCFRFTIILYNSSRDNETARDYTVV